MPRPREFNEATAIAAAVDVFCNRGFHATSVEDLVRATGVNRSSLYGVFGSKQGLFLRALDHVCEPEVDPATRLDLCLVALTDLAPSDERIQQKVSAVLARFHITPAVLAERLFTRAGISTPQKRSTS